MLVTVFVLVFFSQLASAINVDDCPWSQTRDKFLQVFEDKCYYFNLGLKKDFKDAQEICQNEGGNLAMVKSKEINRFLHQELSYTYRDDRPDKRVWIGLNDLGQEGVFRWVDGSAMDYNKFAPGEGPRASFIHVLPSSFEDCVAMDSITGQWFDYHCEAFTVFNDETRPFICEFDPEYHPTFPTEGTTVPTPTSTTEPTLSPNSTSM